MSTLPFQPGDKVVYCGKSHHPKLVGKVHCVASIRDTGEIYAGERHILLFLCGVYADRRTGSGEFHAGNFRLVHAAHADL